MRVRGSEAKNGLVFDISVVLKDLTCRGLSYLSFTHGWIQFQERNGVISRLMSRKRCSHSTQIMPTHFLCLVGTVCLYSGSLPP